MAHKAKDGTEYTNRMMVNKHNARMDSKKDDSTPPPSGPDQSSAAPQDGSQSPTENPDADQHVDAMLASGMTPDDIHQHAKKRSGQQQQEPEQQSSALSSIPGM